MKIALVLAIVLIASVSADGECPNVKCSAPKQPEGDAPPVCVAKQESNDGNLDAANNCSKSYSDL